MSYTLVFPVKGLLSKLAKQGRAGIQPSLDSSPQQQPLQETSPLCFQSRSRSVSHGSDTTLSNFASSALATTTTTTATATYNNAQPLQSIDTFRIDTAIALAIRAKQLDQQGNSEGAARLFAASLEHMSQALRDTCRLHDVHVRERLHMLKLLAAEPMDVSEVSAAIDKQESHVFDTVTREERLSTRPNADHNVADNGADGLKAGSLSSDNNIAGNLALSQAAGNLRSTLLTVAAYGLDLLNQIVILWLLLLGNFFVWATSKFKQSDLPEASARYLIRLGSWIYATGQEWNAPEHIICAGQKILTWMVSLDNATGFSQRMVVSAASILAAIARVAEQSATRDTNNETGYKSKTV